jgi:hypothetical protein
VVDCRRDPAWIRSHLQQAERTNRERK